MSNGSEKVDSAAIDAKTLETPEMILARFVASFEQANLAQADYQALRQRLPGVISEAAQLIHKERDAGIESRNGVAAANEVVASMKRTAERLIKSTQSEYEAAIALLGSRQKPEDNPVNRLSPVLLKSPHQGERLPQPSLSDRLLAPQIAEALCRLIEREVARRLHEARQTSFGDQTRVEEDRGPPSI